ncbi:MAG: TetR family transcriptional regulator C-terminal domain-containing protein [Sphingobium sp.]|nr:TetR family transcriptional regulator C-terminal domain-containing protein [Sphingobium sp.]MDX3909415.1 TetR family transcriptional regulator C-terminal domain-containing protein [Sphingobium sp.]
MSRASFVREAPDVRRQALIDATARCLAERGIAGTSVRAICATAGVSSGLLTHYFDGIDALIVATYRDFGRRVGEAIDSAVLAAGPDPRDRLESYVLASFVPPVLDPDMLAAWSAFWSLVKSSPAMAKAHEETYAEYRRGIGTHIAALSPSMDENTVRLATIGIAALVDGLWLELCLDSRTFTIAEAQQLARDGISVWVDRH